MMIKYITSNVYMVGQKGMWWKCNFDLVPMRGEIATKQLGRLIRFLYPHFTFHISHFTFHISKPWSSYGAIWERFHEVSSGPCRCGAATPAAVYQVNGFCGVRPPQRPGETSGFTMFLASDAMSRYTGESVLVTSWWHMAHCVPGYELYSAQCTLF